MELPNLKELDALIALCRKRGVNKLEIGALKLELSDPPRKPPRRHGNESPKDPVAAFLNNEPTPEELLMWSAVPTGAADENSGEQS